MDTCTTSAKAGDVHGEITIDTSWTAASSPYDLTGVVEVRNGSTLTIASGVMVTTSWWERIVVCDLSALKKGALYADGVSFYDVNVDINGHAEIKNCFFEDAGISVHDSNNHVITGNTVLNSSYFYGIYLGNSSNNVITDNTVLNNYLAGIILDNSSNNVITGNIASDNDWYGIFLHNSSNNEITDNTASNNSEYGICLYNSSNNEIYNNYFNNTNNAYDNGKNTWSSPTEGSNIVGGPYIGGNYWSDYNGTNLDRDMFGDTELPYNCSGGIKNGGDSHPLVTIRSYIVTIANNQVGEHYLWGAEGQIPDDGGEVIMARECMDQYIIRPAYHTAQETTEGSHYCSGRHSEVTGLPPGNPDNQTHQADYSAYSWERYDWRCKDWVYGEACEGHRHFDCSGLVYFVYSKAGVPLVRTTVAGYAGMDTDIARTDLKPGDVCYRGTKHIGIYVGGNKITHAAGHDKGVITTPLDDSWDGFGRLLPPELDP